MKKIIITLSIITTVIMLAGCSNREITTSPTKTSKTITSIHLPTDKIEKKDSMERVYTEVNRVMRRDYPTIEKSADFIGIIQPLQPFEERKHTAKYQEYEILTDYHTKTKVKVLKVFKGDEKPGDTIEIIEPISIVDNGNGKKIKISIDEYDELPYEVPSLTFLHDNGYGYLGIGNAQNSYFPMKKTQNFVTSGEVEATKIEQNRKDDTIHQTIYDGIIESKLLEK